MRFRSRSRDAAFTLSDVIDANVFGVRRGNDSGRGRGSSEPPELATVRRLHHDGTAGSTATETEEWYENERLTGQITGRGRGASPTDQPTRASEQTPLILDWRHAEPAPSAPRRLGLHLGNRRRRRPTEVTAEARSDVQAVPGPRGAQRVLSSSIAERDVPLAPQGDRVAMDQGGPAEPGGQRLGLRGDAPAAEAPRRRWSLRGPRLRVRDRARGWAIASMMVVSVAVVVMVLGITSHPGHTVARPRQAKLAGTAPVPRAVAPSVHPAARASHTRGKPNRRGARRHAGGPRRRHHAAVKQHRNAGPSSPQSTAGAATQTYAPARTEVTSSSQQTSATSTSHTSAAPRTSATSRSGSAGPTGSSPLGGIGSCVKGCT